MKRNMFTLLKGKRGLYAVTQILIAFSAFLGLLNPIFTRIIVDDIILGGQTKLLVPILIWIIAVTVARLAIRYGCQMKLEKITQQIVLKLRRKAYRKLMELDFDYLDTHESGEIMTQMTTDMDMVRHFLAHTVYIAVENMTLFFGAFFILIYDIDAKLPIGLFLVMPVVINMTVSLAKKQKVHYRHLRQVQASLNTVVGEISGYSVRSRLLSGKNTKISGWQLSTKLFVRGRWRSTIPHGNICLFCRIFTGSFCSI